MQTVISEKEKDEFVKSIQEKLLDKYAELKKLKDLSKDEMLKVHSELKAFLDTLPFSESKHKELYSHPGSDPSLVTDGNYEVCLFRHVDFLKKTAEFLRFDMLKKG